MGSVDMFSERFALEASVRSLQMAASLYSFSGTSDVLILCFSQGMWKHFGLPFLHIEDLTGGFLFALVPIKWEVA